MPQDQTSNGTIQSDQDRDFPADYTRPEPKGMDDDDIEAAGRAITALGDDEDGGDSQTDEDPGNEIDDRADADDDDRSDADDRTDEDEEESPRRRKEAPRSDRREEREPPKNESNADRLLRRYQTGTEHDAGERTQDRGRVSEDQPRGRQERGETKGDGGEQDTQADTALFSDTYLKKIDEDWSPDISAPMREANKRFEKAQAHNALLTRTLVMLINDRKLDARLQGLQYLKQYQEDREVADSYGLSKGPSLSKQHLGSLDELVSEAFKMREAAAEANDFVSFEDAMQAAMQKRHKEAVKRKQAQVAKQKRDQEGRFIAPRSNRIALTRNQPPARSASRPSREDMELEQAAKSLADFEQSRARPNGPRRR